MAGDSTGSGSFHDFTQMDVLPRYYFYLLDGKIIKNPIELPLVLKSISDETFGYHVNNRKNDFARWIFDVYGADGLSAAIQDIRDRGQMSKTIGRYLFDNLGISTGNLSLNELIEKNRNSSSIVFITKKDGTLVFINEVFEMRTGYRKEEVLGKKPSFLKSGKQDASFYAVFWATLLQGKPFHSEMVNKSKDGKLFRVDETVSPIMDEFGNILYYLSIGTYLGPLNESIVLERIEKVKQQNESLVEGRKIGPDLFVNKVDVATDPEKLLKDMNDQFDLIYHKTSELRKKGSDTKMLELLLMRIGPKIRIFGITCARDDAGYVKRMMDEAVQEINDITLRDADSQKETDLK